MKYTKLLAVFLIIIVLLPTSLMAASTEMTMEEYTVALAEAEKRLHDTKTGIAEEQAKIEALKQEITRSEDLIAQAIAKVYELLGITQEDVNSWNQEASSIKAKIEGLMPLSADELAVRMNEIKEIEKGIETLKLGKVSWLFGSVAKLDELENLLAQLKSRLPSKPFSYIVRLIPEKRDCLWRIAGYEEIYDNPYEWPKIYSANRQQIDNKFQIYQSVMPSENQKYSKAEDLIYPGQVFDIPR